MADLSAPRYCEIIVEYDGKDITEFISQYLLDFTFNDKASGEAKDVDLLFYDRDSFWITDGYPKVRKKDDGVSSRSEGGGGKKSASKDDLNFNWDDILDGLTDDGDN